MSEVLCAAAPRLDVRVWAKVAVAGVKYETPVASTEWCHRRFQPWSRAGSSIRPPAAGPPLTVEAPDG